MDSNLNIYKNEGFFLFWFILFCIFSALFFISYFLFQYREISLVLPDLILIILLCNFLFYHSEILYMEITDNTIILKYRKGVKITCYVINKNEIESFTTEYKQYTRNPDSVKIIIRTSISPKEIILKHYSYAKFIEFLILQSINIPKYTPIIKSTDTKIKALHIKAETGEIPNEYIKEQKVLHKLFWIIISVPLFIVVLMILSIIKDILIYYKIL